MLRGVRGTVFAVHKLRVLAAADRRRPNGVKAESSALLCGRVLIDTA
jgi:hypothetical protein